MLSLGAQQQTMGVSVSSWDAARWVRHLAWSLGLPLVVVGLGLAMTWISPPVALGLTLCVVSGSGTSGVALVHRAGASAAEAATIVVMSSALSVVLMPLSLWALAPAAPPLHAIAAAFAVSVVGLWLPWWLARQGFRRRPALAQRWAGGIPSAAGGGRVGADADRDGGLAFTAASARAA